MQQNGQLSSKPPINLDNTLLIWRLMNIDDQIAVATEVLRTVLKHGDEAKLGDTYCIDFAQQAREMTPAYSDAKTIKLRLYLELALTVWGPDLTDESRQQIAQLIEKEDAPPEITAVQIASALKPIPKTTFPQALISSTTAVENQYRQQNLTDGSQVTENAVSVSKQADVSVYVTTSFQDIPGLRLSNMIGDDAMNTYNAVVSMQAAGNRYFTEAQLAQVLAGKVFNSKGIRLKDKTIERYANNLELLSHTDITIDATEQAVMYKDKGITEVRFTGPFLALEQVTVKQANGKIRRLWHIISDEMPVLYRYSEQIGQISKIEIKLLDTGVSDTRYTMSVKLYLLRQINGMINGWRKSNKILYEPMFCQCGLSEDDELSKDALKKNRRNIIEQHIPAFCNYWVQQGFIQGYQLHDGPLAKDGLLILLPEGAKKQNLPEVSASQNISA